MVEKEETNGFFKMLKNGMAVLSEIISVSIFPQISEGAGIILDGIDDRMLQIEKRIQRKLYSVVMLGFGGILLALSLAYFLKESMGWSNALTFFSMGIIIFVIGLFLKIGENNK
jgi:hypothetical protein